MKAMKSLILCLALLCGAAVLGAQAPEWQWAVGAGGTASDAGRSIAIDSQGNQYVTGGFRSIATFGSHILTASGNREMFVAKLDPAGNWLWAVQAVGGDDNCGNGIALDGVGNAYVSGRFNFTTTFGSHTLTTSGGYDVFVAKLDPDGNWLWAAQAGGTGWDEGYGIALDGVGNAHVTGRFDATATFGSHTLTADSWDEIFAAKLDPDGNWLWAVQAGGYGVNYGWAIAVDGVGNAYVTGEFERTATFGSHTITASGVNPDIFTAKLNPDGNWLWAIKAGGTSNDQGYGIVLDGAGIAYVTGRFVGTATFGSHTLTASGSSYDIFTAKLDPSGNWIWAVKAGAGGIEWDEGWDIAVDGEGNAYVTGYFQDTAAFGSHTLTARGSRDIFVAKLNPAGNWLWAVKAGWTNSDWGYGIAVDGVGNAYVTGYFESIATFGSHTLTSSGYNDIFVAKLGSGTPMEDDLAPEAVAILYSAWPNPLPGSGSTLIKADIAQRSTGTLSIFNLRGQILARHKLGPGSHQISFGGSGLPSGVYLYSLQCGNYRETKKLVLLK